MAEAPDTSKNAISLKRQLAQVPITSVAFYTAPSGNAYILAGEDGDLTVYHGASTDTEEPIHRISVFEDQPIHGIRTNGDGTSTTGRILVWGASYVALLDGSPLDEASPPAVLATATAPDWIYDAAVSLWDPSLCALATAHNEVVTMRYESATGILSMGSVTSPSRPMLYASNITWTSGTCVLVAAGTVFGDVIVWKYRLETNSHTLLFVLRGHEGSIYGVDISPELRLPNGSAVRLLASCSDDRTIRVWDISEREGPHESTLNGTMETGFKAAERYDEVQTISAEGEAVPVAVAMGHASRIWGVKLAVEQGHLIQDGKLTLYSFGEDSTTQRWELSLARGSSSGTISHQHTYSLHNGKHLWARALSLKNGQVSIVTGGADSKISVIQEGLVATSGTDLKSIDMRRLLSSLPNSTSSPREMINQYDFISKHVILAITSLGRLFLGTLSPEHTWEEVHVKETMAPDLRLCYALRKTGLGAAVIGTTNGKIFYVRDRQVSLVGSVPGRIAGINRLNTASTDILVHLHGSASSHYLTLSETGSLLSDHQIAGLDARFVAVSAARLDDMLVIGSRHGYLSLLTLQNSYWRPVLDVATRSHDAITCIVPLPANNNNHDPHSRASYMLATSRDGKYRIYQIQRTEVNRSRSLILLHETSPPFGPMIEGAWFTDSPSPHLLLYGFRSKDFVVWNESTREQIASVDCGGAHRTFRLDHDSSEPEACGFAYTRTSQLSVYLQARVPQRTVKSGTHGREVRALSCSGRYVASGAEDTSIRIWECVGGDDGQRAEMRCLASMKAHVTGIQKLHWFEDDFLFSSAGNEEFFVWRVRSLGSAYKGLAVVCEGVFEDKSPIGDLRIMDFDVSRTVDGRIAITLAFSNSMLKTYQYLSDGGFKLLATGLYTGACITQLRHVGWGSDHLWLLTASTDGHLALWNAKLESLVLQNFALQAAAQVHQSSIKSLDMVTDGGVLRIMTGGDDNGIGFTEVAEVQSEAGNPEYRFASKRIVRRAHAAAINGVVLLPQSLSTDHEGDTLLGVSVSNDQRIKVWQIAKNKPQRVILANSMSSGVADPGDIAVVRGGNSWQVVLGGVGVEVWSLGK